MRRLRIAISNLCDRLRRRWCKRVRMIAWRLVLRPLSTVDLKAERVHILERKPVALHRVHISPKQKALGQLLNERLDAIDIELYRRGKL